VKNKGEKFIQEKLLKEIKSLGIKEFDNFNSLNLI